MRPIKIFLLPAVLWLNSPPWVFADSDPVRVAELVRLLASPSTSDDARRAPMEELKGHDFRVVLPALLTAMDGIKGGRVEGDTPEPRLPPEARARRALGRVWSHFMWPEQKTAWIPVQQTDGSVVKRPTVVDNRTPEQSEAIGMVLAGLLQQAKTDDTRQMVLGGLRSNYSAEAEPAVAAILRDERLPDQVTAAEILLTRHPRKYAAVVAAREADPKRAKDSRHWYLAAFSGPPYRALGDADRRRVVRAGFSLLVANRSYFTACRLEDFVGERFKPDQDFSKYRDEHGLNEAFFADTVTSALAWWEAHRKDFE